MSDNNTVETFMLPPEHDTLDGTALGNKEEPFKPGGGDDVLDFVMRRIRELTKDEIKEREKQDKPIILTHYDVYSAYIADGFSHDYAYIPCNDYFRHAMAYAMAKAYGVVEEKDPFCVLFMNGYKGFILCDDLNS